jgi:predicted protein tyrosine phosphatase
MPKVINIPRVAAKNWTEDSSTDKNLCWVSIGEPEESFTHVSNPALDKLPNLKLQFWDLTKTIEHNGEILNPPSDGDARMIVDFILANEGKNILVNCAAGVSRSGAVCMFCQDMLGYEWLQQGKRTAVPNTVLYTKMVNCYQSTTK